MKWQLEAEWKAELEAERLKRDFGVGCGGRSKEDFKNATTRHL